VELVPPKSTFLTIFCRLLRIFCLKKHRFIQLQIMLAVTASTAEIRFTRCEYNPQLSIKPLRTEDTTNQLKTPKKTRRRLYVFPHQP